MRLFADLHVHVGRAMGRAVKIAASGALTVEGALTEAAERKGIGMVGLVDCGSGRVLEVLADLMQKDRLRPVRGGGLEWERRLILIPAVEVEAATGRGAAHYLAYFPDLDALQRFRATYVPSVTNAELSSQRSRLSPGELLALTVRVGGLFVLAHAFTPFKGLFGQAADRLEQVFTSAEVKQIAAVELGLSADTEMASGLQDLHDMPFLSNSDAHSCAKIAREYNLLEVRERSFSGLRKALTGTDGHRIAGNFGLDPRLGKYHRTFCRRCERRISLNPDRRCVQCGGDAVVVGVADRLDEIGAAGADGPRNQKARHRPPYVHQVPLEFVPGLGPRRLQRLIEAFGSEMAVLHDVSRDRMAQVVGSDVADAIVAARSGAIAVREGGGGRYGKFDRTARSGTGTT